MRGREVKTKKKKKRGDGLFFEAQRAGDSNCRVHALNAFYGRRAFSAERLAFFCGEFDRLHGGCGSAQDTGFSALQDGSVTCVLRHVVEREARYSCIVVPAGERCDEELAKRSVACFVFTADHVFVEKRAEDGCWWRIDSAEPSGPQRIACAETSPGVGRMYVVRTPKQQPP